jgi:SM-20-related protein
MRLLDLDALDAAPLLTDPCEFVIVPHFLRAEALDAVNRDFPEILEPGNFNPSTLRYGTAFEELMSELHSEELKAHFAKKFGMDLSPFPLDMTVRKFSEASDGNVHNDSKSKIVTSLIYFNPKWDHPGGRLRLVRNPDDINDYAGEVVPEAGTLVSFRRSETSYHGFEPMEGERRSLQMYWVEPKRLEKGKKMLTPMRLFKRWRKKRKR